MRIARCASRHLQLAITTGSANQWSNTPCIRLWIDVTFRGLEDSYMHDHAHFLVCTYTRIHTFITSALSGFLHAANNSLGGLGSFNSCFTNSRPNPLLAPVINTDFGHNMTSSRMENKSESRFSRSNYNLTSSMIFFLITTIACIWWCRKIMVWKKRLPLFGPISFLNIHLPPKNRNLPLFEPHFLPIIFSSKRIHEWYWLLKSFAMKMHCLASKLFTEPKYASYEEFKAIIRKYYLIIFKKFSRKLNVDRRLKLMSWNGLRKISFFGKMQRAGEISLLRFFPTLLYWHVCSHY